MVILNDKDSFDCCGGIEVIATPGHISIYVKDSKTLIAGDAKLTIANPQYTLDINRPKESIEKISNYDIEMIVCYHGGNHTEDIQRSLKSICS